MSKGSSESMNDEGGMETRGSVAALPRRRLEGNILITGGAGFMGRALMKRAHDDEWDARFTVLSRDEQKQHQVMQRWSDVRCVLGDIRNPERLQDIMLGHDIVIHMAALKYIPEAEFNVKECIDVNLEGSHTVMLAAQGVVDRVVALSTDKAVSPLNVYGATKMLMERLFVEQDQLSPDTRFNVVRYGNVIGSTGSVIPTFLRLMEAGLELQVTNPDMTRFWLTYDEAIDLIIEAATLPDERRGVTVIPTCRAASLRQIIEALETVVGGMAEVNVIGSRPGEKPDEALINAGESTRVAYEEPYYYLLPPGNTGELEPFEFTSANAVAFAEDELVAAIKASCDV